MSIRKLVTWASSEKVISLFFMTFCTTQFLKRALAIGKISWLPVSLNLIGVMCFLILMFLAYKKVVFSQQNKLLFLIVAITMVGIYVSNYSLMGCFIPLVLLFIVPIVGFPKIMYLDFIVRLWSVIFTTLVLSQIATKNVYNPVTHFYKLGLGFGNPNTLGMILLGLLMELVLINRIHPKKTFIFIWLAGISILIFATHCRTAIWSLVIFSLVWLFLDFANLKTSKWLQWLFISTPFIFLGISLLFTLWYQNNSRNSFVQVFDLFTSNRLKLSSYYLKQAPLSIFGRATFVSNDRALDMGYIRLLVHWGIFPTFVILMIYSLTIKKMIDLQKCYIVAPMFTILIAMIPEAVYSSLVYNPFMLCGGILLSQYNYVNKYSQSNLYWGVNLSLNSEKIIIQKPVNKLVIIWGFFLAISLVHLQPNINNYIYGNNLKPAKITFVKSTFTKNFPYRHGKPEGVVIHETADKNINASQEVQSFLKTWRKREAYVHAFVDKKQIIQMHPTNRGTWGAGKYANERFIQIELCEENSTHDFAQSVLNDANYTAILLHKYHLKPILENGSKKGTVWSHDDVSKYLGNTDHTDPLGYFAKHNYSMNDFFELVKLRYYHQRPKVNYLTARLPKIQNYIVLVSLVILMLLYIFSILIK